MAQHAVHDSRPSPRRLADVAEASAEDARQLQAELAGELANLRLILVDHVAAAFGVLPLGEGVADRPHAAADAIARVDDRDLRAGRDEIVRRGEACEARATHQHRDTVERSSHGSTLNAKRAACG